MSTNSLPVFDETVHITNVWLKDLMTWLRTDDRRLAYRALRAVLHALRDRLEPGLAVHMGAEMPMLVRGFYYEGWRPSDTPLRYHSLEEFYDCVLAEMQGYPEADPERLTGAVFDLLASRLSAGEIRKVADSLPRDIRVLWRIPA